MRERLRPHHNTINILCFIVGASVLVYLTNNFFTVFAPFIVAYIVTQLLRPLLLRMHAKTKIPNALCALICLLLFIVLMLGAAWVCGHYLVEGVSKLVDLLSSGEVVNELIAKCQEIIQKFNGVLQFLHMEMGSKDINAVISDIVNDVVTVLSNFSINFALQVPKLLVAVIIGCVAAFYMLCDYDRIAMKINNNLSPKLNLLVDVFNQRALSSFVKMVVSYIFISAICFCELLIGFVIIGVNDAVLMALIIAVCDVLPILGSGAFLVPWGIVSMLMGNPGYGIGLIVLWGIIVIVRQVIEPKIVGSQIGLHPLVTISSLYVGLQLMGGLGLVVAPLYIITYQKFQEAIRDSRNQNMCIVTVEEDCDGAGEANDKAEISSDSVSA